jgi:hypothetical protein
MFEQSVLMRVAASDSEFVTIVVSRTELTLMNNALNEVCNGVRELGTTASSRRGSGDSVRKRSNCSPRFMPPSGEAAPPL